MSRVICTNQSSGIFILFFHLFVFAFLPSAKSQTTFTSAAAGDWNVAGNWSCGGCGRYPGQTGTNDIVVINHSITLKTGYTLTVGSITIANNPLIVQGNTSLTVSSTSSAVALTSTGAGVAELLIYATASGSPTVSIAGNVSIVRNSTAGTIRLRVGGSNSVATYSVVSIAGNLTYDYLNGPSTAVETNTEISVGNSTSYDDQCTLNVAGDVNLTYNFANSLTNNVLAFEVGHYSTATMNNLNMILTEGGTGEGSDIRVSTTDAQGASIVINGNANMTFNDATPSDKSDLYLRAGNTAETTASSSVRVKGMLSMTSNYSSATNNCAIEAHGSSTFTVDGNIVFTASATTGASVDNRVSLYDNSILDLKGQIVNPLQGSFDFDPDPMGSNNSTIKFSGTAAQNFPQRFGANSSKYKNITINNTSGTAFTIPTTTLNIEKALTMTNGIITSTSANKLILEDGATANSGSSASYISGPVTKKGMTSGNAITLPLGKGTQWSPIKFSNMTGTSSSTQIDAEYFNTSYSNTTALTGLSKVSKMEYWSTTTSGLTSADVTLYWNNACFSQISDVSGTDLVIARYNGSTGWNKLTSTATGGACSGTGTGNITSTGVTTFNNFTFGSANGANPLPITLADFHAHVGEDNDVLVTWETESETANDYFLLMRSGDGYTFNQVGKIRGAGTTGERHTYEMTDREATSGINYYRLIQVDFDGTQTAYNTIAIKLEPRNSFELFPNPVKRHEALMALSRDVNSGRFISKIISAQGQDVTALFDLKYISPTKVQIGTDHVVAGIYVIVFDAKSGVVSKKFVVN